MALEMIIATFENDENQASEVLANAQRLDKEGLLKLKNVAVIARKQDGEFEVQDVKDVDAKHGALFGAITGGVVGLLGGPVGVIVGAVAGATTGGVSASLMDFGIPDETIQDLKNGLEPGSSTIIAYVEMEWADKAVRSLEQDGATVVRQTLDSDTFDGISWDVRP